MRELIDLKYAAAKAEAKKAAKQAAAPKPSLQARVMGNPKLMAQFMAIKEQLKPEELAQLFAFGQVPCQRVGKRLRFRRTDLLRAR